MKHKLITGHQLHQTRALTFDGEVHGLADISSHIVADFTQVEAAVVLQHMFDKQWTVAQQLDTRATVQKDGLKLGDARTYSKQVDKTKNQEELSLRKEFFIQLIQYTPTQRKIYIYEGK